MSEELTAAVARAMMPQLIGNHALNEIDEMISNAAQNNLTSVRIPSKYVTVDSMFTPRWDVSPLKEITEDLRRRGFVVSAFYEDGEFFSDHGVMVEW